MADGLGRVVQRLRLACAAPEAEVGDAELLGRFVDHGDPTAFELLTWRHGALVWGVCRRMLRYEQDAEDAFQATFLALVRKAGTIGKRESVGSWLYKVAYRTALAARTAAARQLQHERRPAEQSSPDPADEAAWHELAPIIDEAIHGLPDRYRIAFILCCLEGRTLQQAATQLGCSRDTVASRVRRARERLRARLSRLGVSLSVAGLTALLTRDAARAGLPRLLLAATWQAATGGVASSSVLGLTQEVLHAMSWHKSLALLTALLLVLGSGTLACWKLAVAQEPAPAPPAAQHASQPTIGARARPVLAQARTAAQGIENPNDRIFALSLIACEETRCGLPDAAAVSMRAALRTALDNGSDICLGNVCQYAARLGDVQAAGRIADALDEQESRRWNRMYISMAQAERGDLAGARATAARLPNNTIAHAQALQAIAELEARTGHFAAARATANRIAKPYRKAHTLTKTAEQLRRAGQRNAARETVDAALALARQLPLTFGKDHQPRDDRYVAYAFIAEARARAGMIEEARRLAAEIPLSTDWRSRAWKYIAIVQAAAGDTAGALETIRNITNAYEKGLALRQVVTALVLAKDLPAARKLADTITEQDIHYSALVRIGAAQARAGQHAAAAKTFAEVLHGTDHMKDPPPEGGVLKPGLLWQLAAAQASNGSEAVARAWIARLPAGAERAYALVGLAQGIRQQIRPVLPEVMLERDEPVTGTIHLFASPPTTEETALLQGLVQHRTRLQRVPVAKAWHGQTFLGQLIMIGTWRVHEPDISRIQAINPDGTGLATIYEAKGQAIKGGRIAPNGRWLAFNIRVPDSPRMELWLLDTHGKARKLADDATVQAWSEDSKRIACSRGKSYAWENFLLDVDTGNEQHLPLSKTDLVGDWSPDGRWLAVLATNPGKTFEHPTKGTYPLRRLYLYRLADGHREDLKADRLLDNLWPRFSPDGRQLAYHQRNLQNGRVLYDAVVYDLQSGQVNEVLSFKRTYQGYREFRANGFPCWSPDGKQIVWHVTLQHWWSDPMTMGLVFVPTTGGTARSVGLSERGLRFVCAADWRGRPPIHGGPRPLRGKAP